jgi:hypothetical protein
MPDATIKSVMPGNRVRLRRPEHGLIVPGIHVFISRTMAASQDVMAGKNTAMTRK